MRFITLIVGDYKRLHQVYLHIDDSTFLVQNVHVPEAAPSACLL